jgi:hypothetical protein
VADRAGADGDLREVTTRIGIVQLRGHKAMTEHPVLTAAIPLTAHR